MMFYKIFFFLVSSCLIASCGKSSLPTNSIENPSADGFNINGSDPHAILIADQVMEAMGGRRSWDETQFINWNFFGRRKHIWDKTNGLSRIEIPSDSIIMLLDINAMTGRIQKGGKEILDVEEKAKMLKNAKAAWINDSYWLVMPFKLKDTGVTLQYEGRDTTLEGRDSEKLELTFADVGVTPDNKYIIYIDDSTHLVTQWDYYNSYKDSLPSFQSPWPDYNRYGDILLSGGQIRARKMEDIEVVTTLDSLLFLEF